MKHWDLIYGIGVGLCASFIVSAFFYAWLSALR